VTERQGEKCMDGILSYLVLELCWVPCVDWHCCAIHVQLPNNGAASAIDQLWPKGALLAALSKTQQSNQDILPGILVRQKRLPPAIRHVVSPHQLNVVGKHLVVDVDDANLPGSHVSAAEPQLPHPFQCQFAKVSVLNARSDEWHRDVALNAVDASPRGDEGENVRYEIDELGGGVVLIPPRAPQLVEPRAPDHQCWVDLEAVGAKRRILKVLAELEEDGPGRGRQ
jgi:hypothetical protein